MRVCYCQVLLSDGQYSNTTNSIDFCRKRLRLWWQICQNRIWYRSYLTKLHALCLGAWKAEHIGTLIINQDIVLMVRCFRIIGGHKFNIVDSYPTSFSYAKYFDKGVRTNNPSSAGPIWVQILSTLSLQDVLAPTGITKSAGTMPNSSPDFQWFSITLPTEWHYSKGWIRSHKISQYFEFSVTMLTSYCKLAPSQISLIVWLKFWRIIIRFHVSYENPETRFVKFIATFCVCAECRSEIHCFPWASCQICKIAGGACAGNAGNVSPLPRVNDSVMHHGACVTHVPWCMPGSLTSGFFWSRWRGKRSRHSRRMHNAQFYVSGKRPVAFIVVSTAL